MSGTAGTTKGRIEDIAEALTGNDAGRNNGKPDQAAGRAKEAAEKVKDAARKRVGKIRDIVKRTADGESRR